MENNVIEKLEQKLGEFTKAQRTVADYIIRDPMSAAFSTIDKIAHATDVSTASVVRLALSLGYSGFAMFQQDLQNYCTLQVNPVNKFALNNQLAILRNGEQEPSDMDAPILDLTNQHLENIGKTFRAISTTTLQQSAQVLCGARTIYVTGSRTSGAAAQYLAYNLDRMFLNTTYLGTDPNQYIQNIVRMTSSDVLVAVSIFRYNQYVLDIVRLAKERGVTIVVLTDSYDSPFAPYADHQLIAYCRINSFHGSALSLVFLSDVLIGVCSQTAPDRVEKNMSLQRFDHNRVLIKKG